MKSMDWEQRIQYGPYEARANQIIKNNIREKVLNAGKHRRRVRISWTAASVSLLGMLFCVWILNATLPNNQMELVSTLSDDNLLQFIEQSSPNPERGILYKEAVGNNALIIFTHIIDTERKGMTWEVGYFDRESNNWISGGATWVDFVTRTQLEEGFNDGSTPIEPMYIGAKKYTPFPIMYGPLTDPRITQVHITGDNDYEQTVKVIRHVYGGYSLWYAYLPDIVSTTFEIEFMDVEGNMLKTYNALVDSNGVTALEQ